MSNDHALCVRDLFKTKEVLCQVEKSLHFKVQRKNNRQLQKQQNQCKGKSKVTSRYKIKKRVASNERLKTQTFKYVLVGWITHYNYFLHFNHARESVETARKQCMRFMHSADRKKCINLKHLMYSIYLYKAIGWPKSGMYCFGMLAYCINKQT